MVKRDGLALFKRHRIDDGDDYFRELRRSWRRGLRNVFNQLPAPEWLK